MRKQHEQGEQEGAGAECGGNQNATEATGCPAFAAVRSESDSGAAERDAAGEEPVGLQIAGERGRSFQYEAVVLAGRSRRKPDGPTDAVFRRVPPLQRKEAEDVARAIRPNCDGDDRNDGEQNRERSQVPQDAQNRMAFDRANSSTRSARRPEPPSENHFPHHEANCDQHGPPRQCRAVRSGCADPVDTAIGGRTSLTDLGDDLDRADGFKVGRFGAAKIEFAAPGGRDFGRIRGKGAIAGLADSNSIEPAEVRFAVPGDAGIIAKHDGKIRGEAFRPGQPRRESGVGRREEFFERVADADGVAIGVGRREAEDFVYERQVTRQQRPVGPLLIERTRVDHDAAAMPGPLHHGRVRLPARIGRRTRRHERENAAGATIGRRVQLHVAANRNRDQPGPRVVLSERQKRHLAKLRFFREEPEARIVDWHRASSRYCTSCTGWKHGATPDRCTSRTGWKHGATPD